jgi:hypothetical protein
MDSGLLKNLVTGAGSSSQFIGGLVVATLYAVIGVLGAVGSILVFRRIFQGRWEQIFWASFLFVIAAFYLSFAAYFGVAAHAWRTEIVGVAVFLVFALGGLFSRSAIAIGFPCFCSRWIVFPICYRNRLCDAWALGFNSLFVGLVTRGPVDDRNSIRLWYLLLNI